MSVQRSTPGTKLIARCEWDNPTHPFNAGQWTASGGSRPNITVVGTELRLLVLQASGLNGVYCRARFNSAGNYSDTLVYTKWRATHTHPDPSHQVQAAPFVGMSDITIGSEDYLFGVNTIQRSLGEIVGLQQFIAGAASSLQASAAVPAKAYNTEYGSSIWASIAANASKMWDFSAATSRNGTAGAGHTGKPGFKILVGYSLGGDGAIFLRRFIACPGRYVTVQGLSAGHSIEVRTSADVVLGSAVEAAGVAQVDMSQVALETATKLVVLDGTSTIIDSYEVAGEIIEPGETYEVDVGFIAPVLDEVISGSYDVVFTAVPGATAHSLEVSDNGGVDWSMLDANILTAPDINGHIIWPWDTTTIGDSDNAQLRARGTAPSAGPLFYSALFVIENFPPEIVPPARKAWAFTLDGHVFYVLGSFDDATLLYDGTTGQWCKWFTEGFSYWNMHRGVMWRGRVLAADRTDPIIWELDPSTLLDEEALQIVRAVTGFQPHRGDSGVRQGSLRMIAKQQTGAAIDASITLRFSDDGGNTWSQPRTLLLSDASHRLEFRSLGRIRKPGRIWELVDTGGLIRIDGIESVEDA